MTNTTIKPFVKIKTPSLKTFGERLETLETKCAYQFECYGFVWNWARNSENRNLKQIYKSFSI